jgi:chromosome partitioning protein
MNGERIKALRESKGLSQSEFALWLNERLGRSYDRQKISKWEVGAERIPQIVAGFLAWLCPKWRTRWRTRLS